MVVLCWLFRVARDFLIFQTLCVDGCGEGAYGAQASECVFYPGLASHPGHEIAAGHMKQFGGMMSGVEECG